MKLVIHADVGDCPICGDEMNPADSETEHGKFLDHYVCNKCDVLVTYQTPDPDPHGRTEYHQYAEIGIEIVRLFSAD